jgi:hypothetical protein
MIASFAHSCSALREIVLDKDTATKFPTSEKVNLTASSISTATAWTDVENDSIELKEEGNIKYDYK